MANSLSLKERMDGPVSCVFRAYFTCVQWTGSKCPSPTICYSTGYVGVAVIGMDAWFRGQPETRYGHAFSHRVALAISGIVHRLRVAFGLVRLARKGVPGIGGVRKHSQMGG